MTTSRPRISRTPSLLLAPLLCSILVGGLFAASRPAGAADERVSFAGVVQENEPAVVTVVASQGLLKGLTTRFLRFANPFPLRSFLWDGVQFVVYIPRMIVYPVSTKYRGSGFVIDGEGHILTNRHVIADTDSVAVSFADGRRREAELLGSDQGIDIALLKIVPTDDPPAGWVAVRLGDSEKLRPGEWVVAMGDPLGFEHSVTAGIVSAIGRRIGHSDLDDFIQIDAPLNFGNSGGPLFSARGEVVGINTAAVFLGEDLGFAVPINTAKAALPYLEKGEDVPRAWLGVVLDRITPALVSEYDLEVKRGVVVVKALRRGPARAAGVEPGDVIVEINGIAPRRPRDVCQALLYVEPGQEVRLKIDRQGQPCSIAVTTVERKRPFKVF